ncbi:hypothetical protein [Alkalimonas amylolytica]|uniref:Uncharacterized protein n=1 Tax=Alkalimonas amylolytica TaxID=152573 RepID=A0A1H3XIQ8_ALKAM|nr:hypothetical protein [Alkalimonas amylolytica]SDZ98524.1 hypothetical protein SAMN04488051_101239 [Alkalimonas amylolytica]
MKWLVLLMALVLALLAWWVRQPEPSPVWFELSELSAEPQLAEPFIFTEDEAKPFTSDNLDAKQEGAIVVAEVTATDAKSSDDAPAAIATTECPPYALLEEHPSRPLADDWARNELLFFNWTDEHYQHQDLSAIELAAQAGDVLAMRALGVYYAFPMLWPDFAEHDGSDIPVPEYAKARFWLYQAALHNVPMMFAFQALTYQAELERYQNEDGILPESFESDKRQLLVTIRALMEFDVWVAPVLEIVRQGNPLFMLADVELTVEEQQQVAEQLDDLQREWRFHRSQLGQADRIEIEMPAAVKEWIDLLHQIHQCN